MKPIIAYFAHDLSDGSIHRRVGMLLDGGAEVRLFGFRRTAQPIKEILGISPVDMGQTWNSRFVARAWSILRERFFTRSYARLLKGVTAIVSRNLDTLMFGCHAQTYFDHKIPLIYECLDIHNFMLGTGLKSKAFRNLEASFLKQSSGLIISSPAFQREYFQPYQKTDKPFLLVENKYRKYGSLPTDHNPPEAPPWRIGWFGLLRCAKSLKYLLDLAERGQGLVEVIIRGVWMLPDKEGFLETIKQARHVHYYGPYAYTDVPALYQDIHFCWAIDYYQEGANSSWLLSNRLYEAVAQKVVPIALADVESGRWLKSRNCGVLIQEPSELLEFFHQLKKNTYDNLARQVADVPESQVVSEKSDGCALVNFITNPEKKDE